MNARFSMVAATIGALAASPPVATVNAQSAGMTDSARTVMIERALARMRAGPEHAPLQSLVGRWSQTSRYADAPGKPDVVITGTAVARLGVEGRFLLLEGAASGPTLTVDALTILGFDRRFGTYTYVGHDSFGTYYVTAAGKKDTVSNAITMIGETRSPDGSVKRFDMVLRIDSRDRFVIETWFYADSSTRHRAVESAYVRQ